MHVCVLLHFYLHLISVFLSWFDFKSFLALSAQINRTIVWPWGQLHGMRSVHLVNLPAFKAGSCTHSIIWKFSWLCDNPDTVPKGHLGEWSWPFPKTFQGLFLYDDLHFSVAKFQAPVYWCKLSGSKLQQNWQSTQLLRGLVLTYVHDLLLKALFCESLMLNLVLWKILLAVKKKGQRIKTKQPLSLIHFNLLVW